MPVLSKYFQLASLKGHGGTGLPGLFQLRAASEPSFPGCTFNYRLGLAKDFLLAAVVAAILEKAAVLLACIV